MIEGSRNQTCISNSDSKGARVGCEKKLIIWKKLKENKKIEKMENPHAEQKSAL